MTSDRAVSGALAPPNSLNSESERHMRKEILLVLSCLGLALACRDDEESPTGPDTSPSLATTTSAPVYTQVSVGLEHACAVTSDHRLFCWGKNRFGKIGDGSRLDRLTPVAVGGARRFLQ